MDSMKIAFVTTHEILGPNNTGGIQCALRNLSLLKTIFSEENVLVCAITKNTDNLSKASRTVAVFTIKRGRIATIKNFLSGRLRYEKAIENEVIKHISNFGCTAVFMDRSVMGFLQERIPKHIIQILFIHNIERIYVLNQARVRLFWLLLLIPTIISESKAIKSSDIIISLNKRDASHLKKYYNRIPDLIIPITFDDQFVIVKKKEKSCSSSFLQLLFVGSLFAPNEQGVTWFIQNVMPYVNAELTVVGRNFEGLTQKLSRKNVRIIGTVEDLPQWYSQADAIVSPILFGDGMKVKTAEALMFGKPMFATNEALEGYDIEGQRNVFRCNTAQDFISAINTYSSNPPYMTFDMKIRELFLQKYHTRAYIPVLHDTLKKLTSGGLSKP